MDICCGFRAVAARGKYQGFILLRNEILLISPIHYAIKLNGQTQSVLSGDRWDSSEGKSHFRGSHLKRSLPSHYQFDAFMQRGVSVKTWHFFELLNGIMPQNLPDQILQRIVRLLADGNSQRKVARMLGVSQGYISKILPEQILQRIVKLLANGNSQRKVARMLGVSRGCISKILRRNRETSRPHQRKRGGSMKISTPREDRQLLQMVRTNWFISAPRLRMQMVRRFGRRMSVRAIRRQLLATGYWSRRPARCPRLTLEHRRRRREWGKRHNVWDLRQCRHFIFSDESWFPLYHSDGRVWVRRRQGERLIDACVQPNDGNCGHGMGCNPPLVEVWAGRGGWSHEPASVHPDPEKWNVAMGNRGVWT